MTMPRPRTTWLRHFSQPSKANEPEWPQSARLFSRAAAKQAQEMAEARRSQAERDAEVVLDVARKTLAKERELALEEARRVAVDLGSAIAQRLLADLPLTASRRGVDRADRGPY